MTFKPLSDRRIHKLERSQRHSETTTGSGSSPAPASAPSTLLLSDVPCNSLTWLWPGRVPLGHLTLVDAAPGCDLSLFALTLAACISSGSPLPDGTTTLPGNVILLAPYDSPSNTIKPRLEAAGGDPTHVLLFRNFVEEPSPATIRARSSAFSHDLEHLAADIRRLDARLVIFDPASAIPGLSRCLPTLLEIAHQANCAILLTRSLREPPVDPLRSPGPTSPLLEAARTRLLLTPDPSDERQHLLLTTCHLLSSQPPVLTYHILASEAGIPTIHWLGERDRSHLVRLSTGPLRSPQRQAILRFLQNSASPRSHKEILEAACYDDNAGRKMIFRMKLAGELISTARGLYTTPNHPCLAQSTDEIPPVPNVPNVPNALGTLTALLNTIIPGDRPVPNVPNSPSSQSPTNSSSPPRDVPPAPNASSPAHSTTGVPQQQPGASL